MKKLIVILILFSSLICQSQTYTPINNYGQTHQRIKVTGNFKVPFGTAFVRNTNDATPGDLFMYINADSSALGYYDGSRFKTFIDSLSYSNDSTFYYKWGKKYFFYKSIQSIPTLQQVTQQIGGDYTDQDVSFQYRTSYLDQTGFVKKARVNANNLTSSIEQFTYTGAGGDIATRQWTNSQYLNVAYTNQANNFTRSNNIAHLNITGYGDTTTGFGGNTGIRIQRVNTLAASSRGFQDSTKIEATVDGTGYAAFDARPRIRGTRNYDHIVAMQMNPQFASTGTILDLFGSFGILTQNSGTVNNAYTHYIANPVRSSGTMTNNYGIFIEPQTAATRNWGIYNRAKTYLEDSVRIITPLDAAAPSPALKIQGTYPLELRTSFATGIEAYSHSSTSHRGFTQNVYRSRGTETAPTSVVAGDKLYDIYFAGYKTNSYVNYGSIAFDVTDTTDNSGTYTLGVNGNASATQMRITKQGFTFRNSIASALPTASAIITLPGSNGAAGTAPIKILEGITTSPESHSIESNGTNLLYTNNQGRRRFLQQSYASLRNSSIPFVATNNILTSDSANFNYDSTNRRLGLLNPTPTHTVSIGSGGNGIAIYGTTDQTTNFSRLVTSFIGGVATYDIQRGGTGAANWHSFRINGTALLEVDASNTFFNSGILTNSDNSRDIGRLSVSPLRFRSMYLGTSFQVGAAANTTIAATVHAVGASNTSANFAARFQQNNGTDIVAIRNDGNVGIGTSTPTSKLQVVGLPIHADNAAALTAGLTVGAFYHNGDGVVRVVF